MLDGSRLFYHSRRVLSLALPRLTRGAFQTETNTQDKLAGWDTFYGLAQFADAALDLYAAYPIAFQHNSVCVLPVA